RWARIFGAPVRQCADRKVIGEPSVGLRCRQMPTFRRLGPRYLRALPRARAVCPRTGIARGGGDGTHPAFRPAMLSSVAQTGKSAWTASIDSTPQAQADRLVDELSEAVGKLHAPGWVSVEVLQSVVKLSQELNALRTSSTVTIPPAVAQFLDNG